MTEAGQTLCSMQASYRCYIVLSFKLHIRLLTVDMYATQGVP